MGLVSNYSNAGAFAGYKAEQILLGKTAVGTSQLKRCNGLLW